MVFLPYVKEGLIFSSKKQSSIPFQSLPTSSDILPLSLDLVANNILCFQNLRNHTYETLHVQCSVVQKIVEFFPEALETLPEFVLQQHLNYSQVSLIISSLPGTNWSLSQ